MPEHYKVNNITIDIPENIAGEASQSVFIAVLITAGYLLIPLSPNNFLNLFKVLDESIPTFCQNVVNQFRHCTKVTLQKLGCQGLFALVAFA